MGRCLAWEEALVVSVGREDAVFLGGHNIKKKRERLWEGWSGLTRVSTRDTGLE